jgi:hypothetical protein
VESARVDQLASADDQARRLRPAQRFTTTEHDEVGALLCEAPQVVGWRQLRSRIDDDRHPAGHARSRARS